MTMGKVNRTEDSFNEIYNIQIAELQDACRQFDEGNTGKRIIIASVLRNLLKDTKSMSSVLTQYCVWKGKGKDKSVLSFLNTCDDYVPGSFCHWDINNVSNTSFLISNVYMGLVNKKVKGLENGEISLSFKPLFESSAGMRTTSSKFDEWYNQMVYKDGNYQLSRKKLIECIAEQDGGSHLDSSYEEEYGEFLKNDALHLYLNGQHAVFENNPAFETLRQIAFEVLESIPHSC